MGFRCRWLGKKEKNELNTLVEIARNLQYESFIG